MFRISRKTDYSIRVMLALACRPVGARLSRQEVQEEMLIPQAFLQRIIADLSKGDLIRTFPGPGGGLELAYSPEEINLRHIWEAAEGPLVISECLQSECSQTCPLDVFCVVRTRWMRLQSIIVDELEAVTLKQLTDELSVLPGGVIPKAITVI